jgi:hypothetical protein
VRHDTTGPGPMPRLRGISVTNCGNGPARPQRSSLDHPVPVLSSATLRPQENEAGRVSISGGPEGLAGRTRGVTGEAFTPGQGYFQPPSILEVGRHQLRPICAGLVRGVGWAHASIRAKRSFGLVTFARPSGRRPNRRARRLSGLRGVFDA